MPDAWIVPQGETSVLWVRPDATHYRNAERCLVNKGPVPMPAGAVHWLDIERDLLVYADGGQLFVQRGLASQTKPHIVKLPGKPQIHALKVVDDVVYTGAEAGKSMLGFLDLRAPDNWHAIPVSSDVNWLGKGIDGFAVRGSTLVAIDDIVLPRYLLLLDISNPRTPKWIEHRDFPAHSSGERIHSITTNDEIAVMLSTSANHGAFALHIGFLQLATLLEYAVLSVQGSPSFRKWADRSYDFHAIALQNDKLLIAAGKDGLGILPVPPCTPTPPIPPAPAKRFGVPYAVRLAESRLEFVSVPQGPVVGVVAVDETQAFAIFDVAVNGFFNRSRLDSILISLPPSAS